jgi:Uma2 family endonuclease
MARSLPIALRTDPETGLPIAPTSAEWAALTPTQQDDVFWALFDALNAYEELLPPEGSPHSGAQRDAINRMEMDFRRMNRGIFLAVNMMVQYAGERPFAPDLLAVCDVPLHDRNGWIVEREGKGPDFVLEVLFSGDRKKDLKDNVVWFARLGIPEYFVFDGARRQVLGYRLESADARQYSRIVPQFGRLPSAVLGIELAVVEGRLRFFRGNAELASPLEEVELLGRIVAEQEERLGAEAARAEAEAARAEAEAARAEAEAARAEAAVRALQTALLQLAASRGLAVTGDAERTVRACHDADQLARWLGRAATAATFDEVFAG